MSRLRQVGRALLVAFVVLIAVLLIRAASLRPEPFAVEPLARISVDEQAVAATLSAAVQLATIAQDSGDPSREPFTRLHELLVRSFPRAHATLQREFVSELSLLYTWPGSDPEAKPIALLAHQDVVPVDPATLDEWEHPPFSGAVADGFVWGRGTIDDKGALISILSAVEHLIAEGFQPRRTVYLAFGHDEEIGGPNGARSIAALLQERGVQLDFVLDEGILIISGSIPGVDKPIAMIGIGEKRSLSLEITARGAGGHGSTPAPDNTLTRLSEAALRLRDHQLELRVSEPVDKMFTALAPETPFGMRVVLANRWLFEPLLVRALAREPVSNALVRTTTALTVLHTGVKRNVLPTSGRLVVNFRLLPGDTDEHVIAHVRETLDDPTFEIHTLGDHPLAPPSSSTDTRGYQVIRRAIAQVFPDVITAPALVIGATDSAHYLDVADAIYRFNPVRLGRADTHRFHGTNERLALDNLGDGVRFYVQLLREGAS